LATFVDDTFTGEADDTALPAHTGEVGATWTNLSAGLLVSAAGRVFKSGGGGSVAIASGSPATAEYDVEADIVALTDVSGHSLGVMGRVVDNSNHYWFDALDGTGLRLFKRVANSNTQLGSYSTTVDGSYAARLKLELRDGAKKCYEAGVERISSADNALTAAGSAGIRAAGTASSTTGLHLDNFTASDPAAGFDAETDVSAGIGIGATVATTKIATTSVFAGIGIGATAPATKIAATSVSAGLGTLASIATLRISLTDVHAGIGLGATVSVDDTPSASVTAGFGIGATVSTLAIRSTAVFAGVGIGAETRTAKHATTAVHAGIGIGATVWTAANPVTYVLPFSAVLSSYPQVEGVLSSHAEVADAVLVSLPENP
jgi:hypothetical protein